MATNPNTSKIVLYCTSLGVGDMAMPVTIRDIPIANAITPFNQFPILNYYESLKFNPFKNPVYVFSGSMPGFSYRRHLTAITPSKIGAHLPEIDKTTPALSRLNTCVKRGDVEARQNVASGGNKEETTGKLSGTETGWASKFNFKSPTGISTLTYGK